MKAILHVGVPKTGSTSIQTTLSKNHQALWAQNVLVPGNDHACFHGADCMAELFVSPDQDVVTPLAIDTVLDGLETDQALVIISSEYISARYRRLDRLKQYMSSRFSDYRVVMYLREPVSQYVSITMQTLKATDVIVPPQEYRMHLRGKVEAFERAFQDKFVLRSFDRDALTNGSVVDDFFDLTSTFWGRGIHVEAASTNKSPPAEVMYLMQKYFAHNFPGEDRAFRPDALAYYFVLGNSAEKEGVPTSMKAKPATRTAILAGHRDDLLWLKAERGIAFRKVDYDAMPRSVVAPGPNETSIEDIVQIDHEAVNRILQRSVRNLALRCKNQFGFH